MIGVCMAAVETIIAGLGYPKIYADPAELKSVTAIPAAFVWQEEPAPLTRDRRRAAQEDRPETSDRVIRWLLYRQELPINVLLIEASRLAVDAKAAEFIRRLPARILDADNNAIIVTAATMQLIEDRSLLANKVSMHIVVTFSGGIYKDEIVPLAAARPGQAEME